MKKNLNFYNSWPIKNTHTSLKSEKYNLPEYVQCTITAIREMMCRNAAHPSETPCLSLKLFLKNI